MNTMEAQYLSHLARLLEAPKKSDRTGTGTRSIFGHQMVADLSHGFPLLTTKKVHVRAIIHELLWFLSGSTNIQYLKNNSVKIWDEWADKEGDLGPIYGRQWRSWPIGDGQEEIDQIQGAINTLETDPDSRRIIVTAWNPSELDEMALAPCHCLFQFYTQELSMATRLFWANENLRDEYREELKATASTELRAALEMFGVPKRSLSCQLYQRSADWFLGVPFNIASYSLLTMMMAREVNMLPGKFVHSFGDTHLYENHIEQANEQLIRSPMPQPTMELVDRGQSLFDYEIEDFMLEDYNCHPAIKAEVSV